MGNVTVWEWGPLGVPWTLGSYLGPPMFFLVKKRLIKNVLLTKGLVVALAMNTQRISAFIDTYIYIHIFIYLPFAAKVEPLKVEK